MKTMDIREFLKQFTTDDLTSRGILRGNSRQLSALSVSPLMELMTNQDVARLEANERNWHLTSDGTFQNPDSAEFKSGEVEDLENPGSVFNEQNTFINPHYQRSAGAESESENAERASFSLERDLQSALRANIQQLEPGLKVIDGGTERTVQASRIDITAEDSDGQMVVIELKAGKANLPSIAQLLSYMGSVDKDSSQEVRGILVANDFDHRLVMAARAVPNVTLIAYSFQFLFSER